MYFMPAFVLITGCVVGGSTALYIDAGCVVRSTVRSDWKWSDSLVSVWVPPGRHNHIILTLQLNLGDLGFPRDYDNITFTTSNIHFTRIKDHNSNKIITIPLPETIRSGWQELLFTVTSQYEVFSSGLSITLNISDTSDLPIKDIVITGSNLTLNCQRKVRVWEVEGRPVMVPLDGSQHYWLSIFSTRKSSPSLTLGERNINLGWDNNGLTTLGRNTAPLPAFTQHAITLFCGTASSVFCDIMLGETRLSTERLKQSQLPGGLLVGRRSSNTFYFLLHQEDPFPLAPMNTTIHPDIVRETQLPADDRPTAEVKTVVVVVVVFMLLLLLSLSCVLAYYAIRWRRSANATLGQDTEKGEELTPLMHEEGETRDPRNTDQPQISLLLRAVVQGDASKVQQLVAQQLVAVDRDAYVEAHIMGSQQVVDALSFVSPPISRDKLITEVMMEYENRVEEVMKAARCGLYRTRWGVDALLHSHQLPATVRDAHGKTVLHYVASTVDENEGPLWGYSDVQHFLNNHQTLLNARDYDGRTCLLLLAEKASNKDVNIIWDNKKVPLSAAWVSMAKLLVAKGADPRLKDNEGGLPEAVALKTGNPDVSSYLKMMSEKLEEPQQQHFPELMTAIRKNNLESLKDLLKNCHPLLPLGATCDPLVEAVKNGSLEAVLLLLCAGAPLCGLSLVSITALEAAHGRSQLPAIFPALMRKEYANKLHHEALKAMGQDYTDIRENVENLAAEVRENGHKFSWKFTDQSKDKRKRSRKARTILCTAARLGMSLTCQMLGLEDVYLHPLPKEEQPVQNSSKYHQYDTLYTLLRDLNMPLVSIDQENEILKTLSQQVEDCELEQLKNFVKRKETITDIDLVQHVKDACNGSLKDNLHEVVLICISRLGLVLIFHKIRCNIRDFDFNSIVEKLTRTTMLHLAALYGRLGLVEYLLFNGATVQATDKGGLTAAHLAAIKGNLECMEYLHDYMKNHKAIDTNKPSDAGVTAEQLAAGYQEQINDFKLVLLSEEYRLEALSEPLFAKKAKLVLEKKELEFKIFDFQSLRASAREWYPREAGEKEKQLQNEMERFLQKVTETDPRFRGKPFTRSSCAEATFKLVDSLDIFWELDSGEFGDLKVEHDKQDTCCIVSLEPFNSQESRGTFYFRNIFEKAVRQTLETYSFESSKLWLIYPYVLPTDIGLSLYFVWYYDKRTALIRIHIVPVIKVDYPDDNLAWMREKLGIILPFLEDCVHHNVPIHLARNRRGSWTYIFTQMENRIFRKLSEEQQLVYVACSMISKILFSCWWFPVQHSRRHGRAWHFYSLNIRTVSDVLLRSLFLEELRDSQEADWYPSEFLNRMISIFERATFMSNGKIQPKKDIRLILDPLHSLQDANFVVTAIVKHLKELKERYMGSETPERTTGAPHWSPGTPEGTTGTTGALNGSPGTTGVLNGSPGTPEGTPGTTGALNGSLGTPEGTNRVQHRSPITACQGVSTHVDKGNRQ